MRGRDDHRRSSWRVSFEEGGEPDRERTSTPPSSLTVTNGRHKAMEILDTIALSRHLEDEEMLKKIARTAMTGKSVGGQRSSSPTSPSRP